MNAAALSAWALHALRACGRCCTAPWLLLLRERRCLLCRAPFTPPAKEGRLFSPCSTPAEYPVNSDPSAPKARAEFLNCALCPPSAREKSSAAEPSATALAPSPSPCPPLMIVDTQRPATFTPAALTEWLCPACRPALAPFSGARCPACGAPVPLDQDALCWSCLTAPPPWDACAYHGVYRGALRDLLLEYKFAGRAGLARFFAELLQEAMRGLPASDIIVPVPSHVSRLRERGVSQTVLLAKELSRRCGLPVDLSALTRTCATPQQATLGAAARAQAPRGSFAAGAGIAGKRVLLVDDIVTTGSTARHAALCLRAGGAAAVHVLSVARAAL